jgi:hypothetical protein
MPRAQISGYTVISGSRILVPTEIATIDSAVVLPVTGTVEWVGTITATILAAAGVSRCIIGFGEAGYIIYAGSYEEHQPFSQAKGSSEGMPVPFSGKAKKLKVRVHANSLDASTTVIVRKNETDTPLTVTIPSESTGLFENNTVEVEYAEGDRIDFVIDATSSTSGEMDIAGISVCFEG